MGELQGLLLTNRYMPVLPDELRRCTKMKQLSLEYTHTQTLPDWIKEYKTLEYLHIENKLSSPMTTIPDRIFRHMTQLTFIHFSTFTTMTQLPSFTGLKNLKSFTLSTIPELEELPSFENLYNLERLVISRTSMLHTLPDFAHIINLKTSTAVNGGDWCCNGFLGECDLTNPLCQPHSMWNSPPATCLAANRTKNVATPATILAVKNFSSTSCGSILRPETFDGPLTAERINPCNGTLWKQCNVPGAPEAMCYNARFTVIACTANPLPIKMRRLQIERAVGDLCDPKLEAWLGCT